jgi:hypothetical protein
MHSKSDKEAMAKLRALADQMQPGSALSIPQELLTPAVLKALHTDSDPVGRIWDLRNRGSSRELAVETVGRLEELSTRCLAESIRPESHERIVGRSGIKDLELKLDLLFALRVIEAEELDGLHKLRKIRNRFAHDPHLHEFEHDATVIGLTQSLSPKQLIPLAPGDVSRGLRDRFVGAAMWHAVKLHRRLPGSA